jgi:hypothetical protein
MQKMQEIFLPVRLWEWRALTTTASIQTGARQPRPRSEGECFCPAGCGISLEKQICRDIDPDMQISRIRVVDALPGHWLDLAGQASSPLAWFGPGAQKFGAMQQAWQGGQCD